MTPDPAQVPSDDDPPPFLGTWRNLYALVIAVLVLVMVLLWVFSRAFA